VQELAQRLGIVRCAQHEFSRIAGGVDAEVPSAPDQRPEEQRTDRDERAADREDTELRDQIVAIQGRGSQTLSVPSADAETTRWPSGVTAHPSTELTWPARSRTSAGLSRVGTCRTRRKFASAAVRNCWSRLSFDACQK
jgi:hypothetical protein